jgi:hypothetical protein
MLGKEIRFLWPFVWGKIDKKRSRNFSIWIIREWKLLPKLLCKSSELCFYRTTCCSRRKMFYNVSHYKFPSHTLLSTPLSLEFANENRKSFNRHVRKHPAKSHDQISSLAKHTKERSRNTSIKPLTLHEITNFLLHQSLASSIHAAFFFSAV